MKNTKQHTRSEKIFYAVSLVIVIVMVLSMVVTAISAFTPVTP